MLVELVFTDKDGKFLRFVNDSYGIEINVADRGNGVGMVGHIKERPTQLLDGLDACIAGDETDVLISNRVIPFGIKLHTEPNHNYITILFGQHKKIVQFVISKKDVKLILVLINGYFSA